MKINNLFLPAIIVLLFFSACKKQVDSLPSDLDAKAEMRAFVIGISTYAKAERSDFAVIPQNGIELVTTDGESSGSPHAAYLAAIDGHGQEDLFYGYDQDNQATPATQTEYLQGFLDLSKAEGNTILVTDYCSTPANMDDALAQNQTAGYVSFAADERELTNIPAYPAPLPGENSNVVASLSEAQNFLYLINPQNYATKSDFIQAVTATNYDLIIMDLFFHDGTEFSASEIAQLRSKANGGSRQMICYMSIGEAEDYRYYWQSSWNSNQPSWVDAENPNWPGNYKVKYWEADWQAIIYGNDASYLKKVLDARFDGVYLDIIDAFEYYEN